MCLIEINGEHVSRNYSNILILLSIKQSTMRTFYSRRVRKTYTTLIIFRTSRFNSVPVNFSLILKNAYRGYFHVGASTLFPAAPFLLTRLSSSLKVHAYCIFLLFTVESNGLFVFGNPSLLSHRCTPFLHSRCILLLALRFQSEKITYELKMIMPKICYTRRNSSWIWIIKM